MSICTKLLIQGRLLAHRNLPQLCSSVIYRYAATGKSVSNSSGKKLGLLPRGDHDDFVTIYKFNHMKIIAFLSRVKLLQTIFVTGYGIVISYAAHLYPEMWTQAVTSFGVVSLALSVLYAMSHFSRRLIGYAWLNKSKDTVKIAHLTFWGKRNDVSFPVVAVSEIDEVDQDLRNIFLKLKIRNSRDYYYFTLRGSTVLDGELFSYAFGKKCYRLYKKIKM